MDVLKAVRLRALKNAMLEEDQDYVLRKIFRWYSQTFHTPLHTVETLPVLDVMTAFFEDRYERMTEDEMEMEMERLLETEEERKAREFRELAEQDDFDDFAAQVAREEQERVARLKEKGEAQLAPPVEREPIGIEGRRPAITEEPLIKMEFMDDESFDRFISGHGSMGPPDED